MLLKTAVVKESVDQMELVNVTLDFTWRIVQVSLKNEFFYLPWEQLWRRKTFVSFRQKVKN